MVACWFGQSPYIVRRTPHPERGLTCEFSLWYAFTASRRCPASTWRQAIFLLLLTLQKLFIMQRFFIYHYYYYLPFALFFVHRKITRGLRRHSAGLHRPCY